MIFTIGAAYLWYVSRLKNLFETEYIAKDLHSPFTFLGSSQEEAQASVVQPHFYWLKKALPLPSRHMGEPENVAYDILYLASDESKFVIASELAIDGGCSGGRLIE